jgi:hypothetical protein
MTDSQVAEASADGKSALIKRFLQAKMEANKVALEDGLLGLSEILFELDHWYILGDTDPMHLWIPRLAIQTTCMAHDCDHFKNVQYLDEVDSLVGKCWWCKEIVPDEVQGLWRLLNADKMPEIIQRFGGKCS